MKSIPRTAGIAAAIWLTGCAYNPLFPDVRSAEDRAHELDARCAHSSEAGDAAALAPAAVEEVSPAYSSVQSGNDRVVRLRGARLRIRPEPNFSAESLRRGLECHAARVVTGRTPAVADDPYVLPGTWLDLDVASAGDGFVVAVTTDDIAQARQVLERAQRFARGVSPLSHSPPSP